MASGAAKRYVDAIIDIAREQNTFKPWQQDIQLINDMVSDEAVLTYLENPSVQADEKRKAVDSIMRDAQPEARKLVHLLIDRRRVGLIPDLAQAFDEALLEEAGVVLVHVTTAEQLDEAGERVVREQLKRVTGQEIEVRWQVNADIIGGIIARIGDEVIDGSVVNQLRRLRARLTAA